MTTAEYALLRVVPAALERRLMDRRTKSASVELLPTREDPLALPHQELWTVVDVAQYLRRSESWVYKKTAVAVLPVYRLDGWGLRYVPAEIRAWASRLKKAR